MSETDHGSERIRTALSSNSLRHALDVLANATSSTVILFDNEGEVLVGPVAGSEFVSMLLTREAGLSALLTMHRGAIGSKVAARFAGHPGELGELFKGHFAIPFVHADVRAATLTIGDRPHEPISDDQIARIERDLGFEAGALIGPARRLERWTAQQASAAQNVAALVAEFFTELCKQESLLHQRIEELTAVYNIAGLLAGTSDLQEVLDRTARMVAAVMKVKACSIRLLDEATDNLAIRAVHNLSREYLNKGAVTLEDNPIDRAALAGEIVRIADASTDPRTRYPDQARKEGIVSGLVAGLVYRGKGVGVLRVYTGMPHTFTPFDESLLRAVASQAAAAIVNARLLAEAVENERISRQIQYAGQVQRRMVPDEPPPHDHLDIGAVYRPHYNVGGDFYDFITLPERNLGVVIADVSGKGVPASLLMASLRSALRVHAHHTYDIDLIMKRLNRHLFKDTTVGEFATAFYGVITPDGRKLTYCNAGHPPPMLLRGDSVTELDVGGMVLGVNRDEVYEKGVVSLQPEDVILMYTDGATEALNFEEVQFGHERLQESFKRHAQQPAERATRDILWDIRRFRGLADRIDDLTLVVLKVK